jgi:uncharacterized protein
MRKPMFEMLTAQDGKIRIRLIGSRGELLLQHSGFQNKVAAIQGIDRVMRYGALASRFVKRETAQNQFYFELKSPNGRIVGRSVLYHSKQGRDNGLIAVRRAVQNGKVLDLN